jgi:two-component system, response regulator PdtaR
MRVLLIDDNRALAENLAEVLEEEGVATSIAESGEEALAILEDRRFDLVITDMRMPGMDGLEVLRAVNHRSPGTPVIVMTAYARDSALEKAQAAGALGVVVKPIDIDYLIGLVARLAPPRSHVLLVEDDPNLRVNLAEALWAEANLVPVTAGDVASARRAAASVSFPIAVIDVNLPDGSGTDLASDLQIAGRGASCCRIIYITGYGAEMEEALRRMFDNANVRLLEKPFSPERLLALVQEAVSS